MPSPIEPHGGGGNSPHDAAAQGRSAGDPGPHDGGGGPHGSGTPGTSACSAPAAERQRRWTLPESQKGKEQTRKPRTMRLEVLQKLQKR